MKQLIILALISLTLSATAQTGPYSRVQFSGNEAQLKQIARLGVPLDHLDRNNGFYVGEFSKEETKAVFDVLPGSSVLINDLTTYYAQQNISSKRKPNMDLAPEGFELGSMAGFYTSEEIHALFDTFIARYPEYISAKDTIGYSIENRPIYAMRVSDKPNIEQEGREQILYTAVTHAREPMSVTQMVYFLWYLFENTDEEEVQEILTTSELYFIPLVNPDGYAYNQFTNPEGGGMWRKNRKEFDDGEFGVDLNRNFGYNWGLDDEGSSGDTFSNVYRGVEPFSEPETQAIRDFTISKNFKIAMNYHSYGNLLLYPWGYTQDACVDSVEYQELAAHIVEFNGYEPGQGSRVLYFTNGDINDWMYGDDSSKNKILSFVPEVGEPDYGFWPPDFLIPEYAEANLEANIRAALGGRKNNPTSVASAQAQTLQVYPNPIDGMVTVKFDDERKVTNCIVLNTQGRLVFNNQVDLTGNIDLSNLQSGVYVIQITDENQNLFSKKVFIK
ncbi:MAG: carboxypeptidase T [Sphingobacteriales bacterium]|jgi:carboxypeptidase T